MTLTSSNLKTLNVLSEEEQLSYIKLNGTLVQYIDNPSEAVQIESIKCYVWAIQFINNPSKKAIQLHKMLWEV